MKNRFCGVKLIRRVCIIRLMLCEMCGKNGPTKPVFVEGTKLNVCPNCAKFGDEYKAARSGTAAAPNAAVIEERLQRRERRMQSKDIYAATASVELIDDYGGAIRNARMKKGMDQEEFAASISEKKGILMKIESNDLVPDEKLTKKLEKALNITLTEVVRAGGSISGKGGPNKMTLENFIKRE